LFDGRMKLLKVWEGISNLYGVLPRSVVVSRAILILALDALLLTEDPPPNSCVGCACSSGDAMGTPMRNSVSCVHWALL
jgi:hypothetical protein